MQEDEYYSHRQYRLTVGQKISATIIILLAILAVMLLLVPGKVIVKEINIDDLSSNNSLLLSILKPIGYYPVDGKYYYEVTYDISLQSYLPFAIKPVMNFDSDTFDVVGCVTPNFSYEDVYNLALPFEKIQPISVRAFGQYDGKFCFIIESDLKDLDVNTLLSSSRISLLNMKSMGDLSDNYYTKITVHLFPRFRIKF